MTKMSAVNTWVAVGLAAICTCMAQAAGEPGRPAATNAPAAGMDIPKSEFDDALPNGRDPFFPKFQAGPVPLSTNTIRTASTLLQVKGMSVRADKKMVVIAAANEPGKSWSLEPGDEREIVLGGTRTRIRCDEIRENAVVLSIGIPPQRVEVPIPKSY